MPGPAWEDLGDFLQEDDFAVPATINQQDGRLVRLSVLFDDPNANPELGDAFTKDTRRPMATCRECDVRGVRRGDRITLHFHTGTRAFDILTAAQPDGTGMATLELAPP